MDRSLKRTTNVGRGQRPGQTPASVTATVLIQFASAHVKPAIKIWIPPKLALAAVTALRLR